MEFKAFFVLLLFLCLTASPVSAGEINPSVESQPFFCKYSITKWTPLCVVGTGGGSTTINADNNTYFYNSTSNETTFYSNTTSLFNITIGNNLTTISNYTYFTLVNITYSEMNQTPGPQGEKGDDGYTPVFGVDYFNGSQGINGTPGIDGYTPVFGVDYFNGSDGADGADGADGSDGADGYTPIFGVDYFNGSDGADGYTPVFGVDYFNGSDGAPGAKGDKGDTGDTGPMNMTPNMTAGPMNMTMNQTILDLSWNTSYQTIANQSSYDIAVNTSMKNYADSLVAFKGARAYNSSDQPFTTAGWRTIFFNSETFDTDTIHSTATDTDRLTAATSGYYYIEVQAAVGSDNSGTTTGLQINYNGTSTISQNTHAGLPTYDTIQSSTIYYLPAGAFVNASVYSSKASPKIYYFAGFSPVFEMYRIG